MSASLIIVGCGIKFLSHLTSEAKAYIEQSDKLLYLVNDPAMKEWLQKSNPNTESLDEIYQKYTLRNDSYQAITEYILSELRKEQHVCVVLYGHPTVFAKPGLDAVAQAKREGYEARILPGISAEACLFADLLIDPGTCGCQSFEATDFLIHQRQFDTSSHLILWQIDIIGALHNPDSFDNANGLNLLLDYLIPSYPPEHEIYLYEAAQYPGFEPKIEKIQLGQIVDANLTRISTLYIPPAHHAVCDTQVLDRLNIKHLGS